VQSPLYPSTRSLARLRSRVPAVVGSIKPWAPLPPRECPYHRRPALRANPGRIRCPLPTCHGRYTYVTGQAPSHSPGPEVWPGHKIFVVKASGSFVPPRPLKNPKTGLQDGHEGA
jgi:hypothetical protein